MLQNSATAVLHFENTEQIEFRDVPSEESWSIQLQENSRPILTSGGKRQMKRAVRYHFGHALSQKVAVTCIMQF
jgi:hypothetical protein